VTINPDRLIKRFQPWSAAEVELLRSLAPSHTVAEVAERLNRRRSVVENKADVLGISFKRLVRKGARPRRRKKPSEEPAARPLLDRIGQVVV
jgi:predicted transcriptional regulator